MARFLGAVEGRLGNVARRLGDDQILTTATAANVGVLVNGYFEDGRETFHIYATAGRARTLPSMYLGRVYRDGDGRLTFIPHTPTKKDEDDA